MLAVHPDAALDPVIAAPPTRAERTWTREEAIVELLRGRLGIVGPTTAAALAESLGVAEADADAALLALESEGVVLRGIVRRPAGSDVRTRRTGTSDRRSNGATAGCSRASIATR